MILQHNSQPLEISTEDMVILNEKYKTIGQYVGLNCTVRLQEYECDKMCIVVQNGVYIEKHYFSKLLGETQMQFDLRVNTFYNKKIENAQ